MSGLTFHRGGGSGGASGTWERLSTATASASATVDFTGLSSSYVAYKVVFSHVVPATDNVNLWLRTSTDGGSSFDAGASDYGWANSAYFDSAATNNFGDAADSEISFTGNNNTGTGTGEQMSGVLHLLNSSAAQYAQAVWQGSMANQNGVHLYYSGAGRRLSAADVDAIRFLFSSGNIASGQFDLYGMKAA